MTTPAPEGYRRDHGCQTPGCPSDFNVILIRVDDSSTDYFCEACHLSFAIGVLQQLGEQGTIPDLAGIAGGASPGS